jgi:hypothetical protein
MQKLIKISDYYYVVDNKAEIVPEITWCINKNEDTLYIPNCGTSSTAEYWNKIIATTNPSLPLPQITNASDDMVGKEVEVEFKPLTLIDSYISEIAILKPISKGLRLPDDDIFGVETSINGTLEEVDKEYSEDEVLALWKLVITNLV